MVNENAVLFYFEYAILVCPIIILYTCILYAIQLLERMAQNVVIIIIFQISVIYYNILNF